MTSSKGHMYITDDYISSNVVHIYPLPIAFPSVHLSFARTLWPLGAVQCDKSEGYRQQGDVVTEDM